MRYIILLTFLCFHFSPLKAQDSFLTKNPINIGYFGHYLLHPGIKVGTQYNWHNWTKEKERKKGTIVKNRNLYISPQIGFYVHPKNHTGVLLNADFGYQGMKMKHGFYHAYAIGLGLMTQFNSGITYTTDENGNVSEKRIVSRSYFLPTLNMEFGQQINSKIGWYSKFSVGSKLFYNTGVSFEPFMELGIKLNLGTNKKTK